MNFIIKFKDLLIETVKENKKLILIFYCLFIVSFILAWALSGGEMQNIISNFQPTGGSAAGEAVGATELFIANEWGGIIVYFASIFFGIAAFVAIIYNGINLGLMGSLFANLMEKGSVQYIAYLIPHGIFEITALVVQSVAGVLLFMFIWNLLKSFNKSEKSGFKEKILSSYEENKKKFIQSLVLMIFGTVLLLIAAPIEAYVSIPFSQFILGV